MPSSASTSASLSSSATSAPIDLPAQPTRGRTTLRTRTGTTPPSAHPCPQFADLVYSLFSAYRAGSERRVSERSPSPGSPIAAVAQGGVATRTSTELATASRAFRS